MISLYAIPYKSLKNRQGWKKSKFSEWPAEFSVISSDKELFVKKVFKNITKWRCSWRQ